MSMPSVKSRKITIVQEIPISKTIKFWQELKSGKIYTTKCVDCRTLHFPPTANCPTCLSSEMEWVELSSEAIIETFTHIIIRPASFQHYKPYTVAVGKLQEGVKVLAWVKGIKMSAIKVGLPVKLTAVFTSDGKPSYAFVPYNRNK